MKPQSPSGKEGAALVIVMTVLVVFTLMVTGLLQLGSFSARETEEEVRRAQSFWAAEAGAARCVADLDDGGDGYVSGTLSLSRGAASYSTEEVNLSDATNSYAIIAGVVTVGGQSVTNRIRIRLELTDWTYTEVIAGLNRSGMPWTFLLSGSGNPVRSGSNNPNDMSFRERGGKDEIWGDVYAVGDIYLRDQSFIRQPAPNTQDTKGDATTSPVGGQPTSITTDPGATISGTRYENEPLRRGPDLNAMNYAANSTYNLTQIFNDAGVTVGRLPRAHPLYNVVRRAGNDYYFEPTTSRTIEQLNLGDDTVFYADGNVWFDKNGPLQFNINGRSTIVATGNIHISDSLRYLDRTSGGDMLALIALGRYDGLGNLTSGGNVYFGDARFGTLYEVDAFMFAADNFYYNYNASDNTPGEPHSGFNVFGNFVALNQINVHRDWYGTFDDPNPAVYVNEGGVWKWKDAITGTELTSTQINGGTYQETYIDRWGRRQTRTVTVPAMRHYRLIAKYDERIRLPGSRPPRLPNPRAGEPGDFQGRVMWQYEMN